MRGEIEEIAISILAKTGYEDGLPYSQHAPVDDGSAMPSNPYHPFGFKGRPRGRDVDSNGRTTNGARVLYLVGSNDETHVINLDDPRRTAKLPQLDEGGAMMYADVDDAYTVYDGQGNKTIKVPSGKSVTIDVGGGITIVASSSGVQINGVTPEAPVQVGQGTPTPVILGASPGAWGKPSTILFAGA